MLSVDFTHVEQVYLVLVWSVEVLEEEWCKMLGDEWN